MTSEAVRWGDDVHLKGAHAPRAYGDLSQTPLGVSLIGGSLSTVVCWY